MTEQIGQSTSMAQLLYETHTAFRYVVDIAGITVGAFTECTLPVIELDVEELREGGLNTYVHLLPGQRKAARLTLKNGLGKSGLMDWCLKTFQEEKSELPTKIETKTIVVTLRNASGKKPICSWHLHRAYPVKWTAPQLQSDSNTIAIQTIEFACGLVEVEVGEPITD
jgi:phage tail-like protein